MTSSQIAKIEILLVGIMHQYQWRESSIPSQLEQSQRSRFVERVREIVRNFQPNVVADETPDTDNPQLLAILPTRPVPVDIPHERKLSRRFDIRRSFRFVCPYVDSVRERYWRHRLHHLVIGRPEPRVLMFIGALHLEGCFQRIAFPELLMRAGYSVEIVNLYKEADWDHSWVWEWRHPITPTTAPVPTQECCVLGGEFWDDQRCKRKVSWKDFLASQEDHLEAT
jgi:hypothetical protein